MRRIVFFLSLFLSFSLYAQTTGSWSGVIEEAGLEIVFNIASEEGASTFDVPGEGAFGLPLVVSQTAIGGIRLDIPALMAYFDGLYVNNSIVGSFNQNGQKYAMSLKKYTPKAPNRPQTPKEPFAYSCSEHSFYNGDAKLCGTLVLPPEANFDTPMLLFVTGSGAQDRDEEIVQHRPFAVIADALANNGIGSLRYDDRGFASSTGDRLSATTDTLAIDALRGVEYLRSLGYKKVGIIGHSEGGTIAFMLAARGAVDFVVSLAGMAESGEETINHQIYAIALAQGASEQAAKASVPAARNQILQSGVWGQRFLELNPADYLKDVKCPLLALNGENDKNVIMEYNIPIIKSLVPHSKVITYPGLNHLFQPSKNGTASEYYSIETTISPEVLEDIIEFVLSL